MLNNCWWFKLLTNRFKGVEGVTPEDMVNECTTRRQELIGTCTIWVFFYLFFLQMFCLSSDNDQSEQRKNITGSQWELNMQWNKIKCWKMPVIKSWLFQVLNLIGWELKRKGKIFWTNLPSNINTTSSKQVMRIKKNIN